MYGRVRGGDVGVQAYGAKTIQLIEWRVDLVPRIKFNKTINLDAEQHLGARNRPRKRSWFRQTSRWDRKRERCVFFFGYGVVA